MTNYIVSSRGAYVAPESEALELRFREGLLSGSDLLQWGNVLDPGDSLKEDELYLYDF